MSLPNYSPTGKILFGSVPWDNGYTHVRLYNSRSEQYEDIASQMYSSSENYTYIGRERRIKVDIEADRLYSCNYCMYRNESLTDTYIYCFVTDVIYINDHTSELLLETDIFQTYLYEQDWDIRGCFVARETVASESNDYLLSPEPDFALTHIIESEQHEWFRTKHIGIFSASEPAGDAVVLASPWNPAGKYADSCDPILSHGVPSATPLRWYDLNSSYESPMATEFISTMNRIGSIDSIIGIISIPDFYSLTDMGEEKSKLQDSPQLDTHWVAIPNRGDSLDGYTPRNKKLLYYPYTYCNVTDYNGSNTELRYEFLGSQHLVIKYVPTLECQAYVFPEKYMGVRGYKFGFPVMCGTQGSISTDAYATWLAQNTNKINLQIFGAAVGIITSGFSIASAVKNVKEAVSLAKAGYAAFSAVAEKQAAKKLAGGLAAAGAGISQGAQTAAQLMDMAKLPNTARGQLGTNTAYATGLQGVHIQKICLKAENAAQLDAYFDKRGYAINRIKNVNITSRPYWNYIETVDSAPRSLNSSSGSTAPFSRGRGTPAAALDVIRRAFDNGVTFWHTTTGFGDYSQNNSL